MATKKVNKVITPLDEKETFVSLQKNMADTDAIAMEEKLRTLYQIQQTDTKIDKIHLLRGELPLEVQDLEDEVAGLKTRISKAEEEIHELEKANANYRHSIEECKVDIAKYEAQRENVKNNREYDSISKEIEYKDLEQQVANKRINENEAEISQKKEVLDEARKIIELREADLEEKKKELETIVEETAKEEEVLVKAKDELLTKIDDRMKIAYNRVRDNAHNHLAVVTVQSVKEIAAVNKDKSVVYACGGCYNKIPPQTQLDIKECKKIIVCEYCGRILVSSDFDKAE